MKTFPTPKVEYLIVALASPNITNTRANYDLIAYIISQFPSMADRGMSGYAFYATNTSNPFDGGATNIAGFYMGAALLNSSPEDMQHLWAPIIAHANATWPGLLTVYLPKSYPSFFAWYQENYDSSSAGMNTYAGSRLLDAAALTDDLSKSAAAFERFAKGTAATAYLVSGKGVHNAQPRGCGNAVLPAWRKAYVHASYVYQKHPLSLNC